MFILQMNPVSGAGNAGNVQTPALSQLMSQYNTLTSQRQDSNAVRLQIFRQIFPDANSAQNVNTLYGQYMGAVANRSTVAETIAPRLGEIFGRREAELLVVLSRAVGNKDDSASAAIRARLSALRILSPFRREGAD